MVGVRCDVGHMDAKISSMYEMVTKLVAQSDEHSNQLKNLGLSHAELDSKQTQSVVEGLHTKQQQLGVSMASLSAGMDAVAARHAAAEHAFVELKKLFEAGQARDVPMPPLAAEGAEDKKRKVVRCGCRRVVLDWGWFGCGTWCPCLALCRRVPLCRAWPGGWYAVLGCCFRGPPWR